MADYFHIRSLWLVSFTPIPDTRSNLGEQAPGTAAVGLFGVTQGDPPIPHALSSRRQQRLEEHLRQTQAYTQMMDTDAAHLLPDTNRRTGSGRPLRCISCSISHTIQAPMLWPNSAYAPSLSAAIHPQQLCCTLHIIRCGKSVAKGHI